MDPISPPTRMRRMLRWVTGTPNLEYLPFSTEKVMADSLSVRFGFLNQRFTEAKISFSVFDSMGREIRVFSTKGRIFNIEASNSPETLREIWLQTPGSRWREHAIRLITRRRRIALNNHECDISKAVRNMNSP